MAKYCITPACDEEAKINGRCRRCYGRNRYWADRSAEDKLKRINQIGVWTSSLKHSMRNVSPMVRRKRA